MSASQDYNGGGLPAESEEGKTVLLSAQQNQLEGQAQRQLHLARVEYGARRAIGRIGRAFLKEGARSADSHAADGAEIGCSVRRVEETDIDGVEQVKGL